MLLSLSLSSCVWGISGLTADRASLYEWEVVCIELLVFECIFVALSFV
uniref:Uncharacterized protein n=1 Tax=Rhizophora mucronata TaxID=61149 RepID=A0A2P2R3I6_RHIMU